MEQVDYLVVGAGVSGLSFANAIREGAAARGLPEPLVLVVEADDSPGGYCKTVEQDGFVWDYSGHFFHFRHPEIERWLRERMPDQEIRKVVKRSFIRYRGLDIDFPFQKNIHQLAKEDFIDCLASLYFRDEGRPPGKAPRSFKDMLYARFGRGIAERFLIPYNEKLYACDLDTLDVDAMGRFFPHADTADIIRNMQRPDNASYNASFIYPRGGAIQFIRALLRDLPAEVVSCRERLESVDLNAKIARTHQRTVRFGAMVSSAPFTSLCKMTAIDHDAAAFSSNKVLVYNLGFDKKGTENVHWMYFPERETCFYRVGYYDNIMDTDRMSLYVEIGAASTAHLDVDAMRAQVLTDLARSGVVTHQALVSWHSVVLDPAYVHITERSTEEHQRVSERLRAHDVYSVGRYGGWTYCSIEDNIVETRALAGQLLGSL